MEQLNQVDWTLLSVNKFGPPLPVNKPSVIKNILTFSIPFIAYYLYNKKETFIEV
jgi:hypothetical protein